MLGLKKLNRCDIYIALNVLYSMQGLLYPSGAINQILQLVIILWGLVISSQYFFGSFHQTKLLKAISALVAMYCLYGGALILFGNPLLELMSHLPSNYIYLQVSLRSLLRIYVFYHYTRVGYLTSHRIRVYAIVLLLTLIPQFYFQQAQIMLEFDREEVTNNIGYTFLSIIPTLFFFNKKPLLQYLLLAITMLYIVLAMKRGAIAIGVVAVLALIWPNINSKESKHRFWAILFTIALIAGTVVVVSNMMSESDYFAYRVEQTISGDSSGRDSLYSSLWPQLVTEPNLFYFLFGRGADSTWALVGNYAHQDWLETLCNNGLIGCLILFGFFFCFLQEALHSKTVFTKNYFSAYMILFFIVFAITLFSMSIQSMEVPTSLSLGFFTYWMNCSCQRTDIKEKM